MNYRTQALVLRARKYGETDSLLTMLTDQRGKVGAIAKGVRKPVSRLRGGVQPLTHTQLALHGGRSLHIVTQAEIIEAFRTLHGDLDQFGYACYMAELVDKCIPEGEGAEVFPLLLTCWHLLAVYDGKLVARLFELHFLARQGYIPELEHCVCCGKNLMPFENFSVDTPSFSPQMGGVVGMCCSYRVGDKIAVMANTLAFLKHILSINPLEFKPVEVGKKVMMEAAELTRLMLSLRYEGKIKSIEVISCLAGPPVQEHKVTKGKEHEDLG